MRSNSLNPSRLRAALVGFALLTLAGTSVFAQSTNSLRIPLTGLRVVGGGTTTPSNPENPGTPPLPGAISLSAAMLDFGSVATHTTEVRQVTLTNSGGSLVAFSGPGSFVGDAGFDFLSNPCTGSLEVNQSCAASVAFTPTNVGSMQATVSFPNNTTGSPNQVGLTATAYNPLSLAAGALPLAKVGEAYSFDFKSRLLASNETSPQPELATWSSSGALPAGLSFGTDTGLLAGTPTAPTEGTGVDFTVLATYKNNQGQQVFTIRVGNQVLDVTALSGGINSTCAVTPGGLVKCWGSNSNGQLGVLASTASSSLPVTVSGISGGATSVSVGDKFACAVVSGAAKCWGTNALYQGGNNATTQRNEAWAVSNLNSGVTKIEVGREHACAVAGGNAYCWGENSYRQTGVGTTYAATKTPFLVRAAVDVAAGSFHSCLVDSSGQAFCWGSGVSGRRGDGGGGNVAAPQAVQDAATLAPLTDASSIYTGVGSSHTCIRTVPGGIKCWGENTDGRLGNGNNTTQVRAVPVPTMTTGILTLAVGASHTCAALSTGVVKCWGGGTNQQLGQGASTASSGSPLTVSGIAPDVTALTGGEYHTCALSASQGLLCWGANTQGQLGDGTTVNRGTPTPVKP